jgi:holo-[acyl-carrier protein] synthase
MLWQRAGAAEARARDCDEAERFKRTANEICDTVGCSQLEVAHMIIGIGIDIIEIARIEAALRHYGERLLNRVFTPAEVAYAQRKHNPAPHLAGRFAAKEAALKALGTGKSGGIRWRDVEILPSPSGKPRIEFHGRAQEQLAALGGKQAHVTISHGREAAVAQVIIED